MRKRAVPCLALPRCPADALLSMFLAAASGICLHIPKYFAYTVICYFQGLDIIKTYCLPSVKIEDGTFLHPLS